MRVHYDPAADIALMVIEPGETVSEEHEWGLIDRDPTGNRLMGFELWEASRRLPPELVEALPRPDPRRTRGPTRRR
jgi:uncharacterized protein YuzE